MAIEYFPCYHSYLARLAKLSDQEVGRLFRALLIYSATGEAPELTGRESVAFDFIQYDIDKAHENSNERSRKNTENVNKRWNTNDTNVYDRIPSNTNDTITNTNTRTITKTNDIPPNPQGGDGIPYAEIVDFLNEKAGTAYKPGSGKTRACINARWREGFRYDDFKAVIAKKTAQWKGTDMAKYLRPETLFGTKFEGYLNEGGSGDGKAGGDSSPSERLGLYL